ncbi:MAG: DUF5695 domain-containing protein [Eubacteriales bacterium]|nr:DUF5695 domain-containing protein [Eubacteriales bacterium]
MPYTLANERLQCRVDENTGTITSLTLPGDEMHTEFAANAANLLYPQMKDNDQWLGDWRLRVWDHETRTWRMQCTAHSGDVRRVEPIENGVRVRYEGGSASPDGLQTLALTQDYVLNGDLVLRMTLTNVSDQTLDVGEVSLALMTNTDFNSLFEEVYKDIPYHWYGPKQRDWHEKRVFQHLHLAGAGSYAFLQRPKGDFPGMLLYPQEGTYVETAYQMTDGLGSHWGLCFEGPYYLSLYSKAPRQVYGWLQPNEYSRYWFNGNNSLVLKAGQSHTFTFRVSPVASYADVPRLLYENGSIAVHAVPGMVAPISQSIRFSLRVKGGEPAIRPEANNVTLRLTGSAGDTYRYTLTATEPGQKKLHVTYASGETNLLFFVIANPRELLCNHASFVSRRQFYDNPQDLYNRHGLFLPYDDQLDTLYLESEESWQVGGTDEYCFTVAMFLAEKNAHFPCQQEIDVLERFVDEGLWRSRVQDPDTFEVIRGMFWEENTPADADQGNKWTYERSRSKLRTFNYPLLMDVFFALYQISTRFGFTHRHTGRDYLTYAYRCALLWFELGRNKNNGAPAGATITEVLDALRSEMPDAYNTLYPLVEKCAQMNRDVEYPYGSELYVDQTAHNQLEALMSYFGYTDKLHEAWRITKALRAGMQPSWYKYGNEKRGNVCVWYATPLNTRALYHGYEALGDEEMLRWGYGGLASFLTTLRLSGVAHGWFTWWPDRAYFDQRSLDTDMGMYGYFKSAAAYVTEDEDFGWVGYGCETTAEGDVLTATINDGVGRRVRFLRQGVRVDAVNQELLSVSVSPGEVRIRTAPVCGQSRESAVTVRANGRRVFLNDQPASEGENRY